MTRRYCAILLVAFFAGPVLAADGEKPPAPLTVTTLDNGLHVTVVHNPLTDITAAHLAVDVCEADIPKQKAGIRSVVQELMIQQLNTQAQQEPELKEFGDAIRGGGDARINAETEYVQAQFAVPTNVTNAALGAFADLFFADLEFEKEDVASAKDSVISDIEESLGQASYTTYQLFLSAMWGDTTFHPDVATRLNGIGALSSTDLASCRKTFYTPDRGYLTVVSALDEETVLSMVKDAFGQYSSGASAEDTPAASGADRRTPHMPDTPRLEVGESKDLRQASMFIGVPLPPYGTKGLTAGQIAYLMLAGEGGRLSDDEMLRRGFGLMLPKRIYEEQPPFEVLEPQPMSTPFIAVHVVANPLNLEEARQQVLGHILAIAKGSFDRTEFERAKAQLKNHFAQATETYAGQAQLLNLQTLFGGDPGAIRDFDRYVDSISEDEVLTVARDYFPHHAIGVQLPAD
ncbi:MAG: pitrilysin family protein [Armatimonadota bacterium]